MGGYGGNAYGAGGSRQTPVPDGTAVEPETAGVRVTATQTATARIVLPDQVVTIDERKGIEVILGDLWRYIADGALGLSDEDVAQLQAVVDTLRAQSVAPRPSRKVIAWTLTDLNQFFLGMLSNEAVNHLGQLLHVMHV